LSPAAFLSPASLSPPVLRAALLWLSQLLLRLPASLLPRDLDLLRAAEDLPLSPVASSPLARPPLRLSLLVRRVEMKQAPGGAPVFTRERGVHQSLPSHGLTFHGVSFASRHCTQCSGGQLLRRLVSLLGSVGRSTMRGIERRYDWAVASL